MNKKRLIISSIISISLVAILLLGSTYSIFTTTEIDESANIYTTGNLDISYTLSSDNVTLTNNLPLSDDEATSIYPYRITVTNNGTVPYQFDVILNDTTANNPIDYQYIMTKVGYLDSKKLSDCDNNIIKEDIVVLPGTSVNIDIRIWISNTITNTELGKNFYAKLAIDGLAIYYDNGEVDNSNLSLRYMKTLFTDYETLDYTYFREDTYRENIKNASFVNYIDTSNAVESWDVSEPQDNSIIAWIENNEIEGYYNLYIGSNQTIYAKDLGLFFEGLYYIDGIDLSNLDTALTTNMSFMFSDTGADSTVFTLDLGDKFNTSNVNDMSYMFSSTGYSNPVFTLDLGSKFNTSNVTDMRSMFFYTGDSSTVFTLDLRDKFDTSNVTNMSDMFEHTGTNSTVFTLDLGDKFNTSSVTDMSRMFYFTGYSSTVFTLDLRDKFDTSNVMDMGYMFHDTGYSSPIFTLDLGDKFDTSNVTNMPYMFGSTGYSSTVFTLDLGSKFDTSNVTDMTCMFYRTGYSSTAFTLDLGSKFDTSNVTNMHAMFDGIGYSSPIFTLDLGSKFDTSNVTNMGYMFRDCRSVITSLTIRNANTTYTNMFNGSATTDGANITVNYTNDTSSLVDSMIATKSSTSNVIKGSLQ